jgi:cell filamentation protein
MTKFSNRYSVPEDENYEPESNDEVLKNYLSIKTKNEMDNIEAQELQRTETEVIEIFDQHYIFTAEDICNIHELWLGDIYPFAGKYRTVTMSKDGFPFSNPQLIEKLMNELGKKYLSKYTPCVLVDLDELAHALGLIHVEFIIIHPFREGNGRIARLLATLMALQAGKPPLNFEQIDQTLNIKGFKNYISAIQNSCNENNYYPIQEVFKSLLLNSI